MYIWKMAYRITLINVPAPLSENFATKYFSQTVHKTVHATLYPDKWYIPDEISLSTPKA